MAQRPCATAKKSDATLQGVTFGTHIEHLEVDELSALRRDVTASEVQARVEEFRSVFDVQPNCAVENLCEAARTAVAFDRLVAENRLGSLALLLQRHRSARK
jgi:L-arabinose isomerase